MFRLSFFPVHWFSLLLAINGIAPRFAQTDCEPSAIEECTNTLKPVMENPDIAFPKNDVDLDISCRYYNQYMVCIHNYANRCFKAEGKDAFLGVFSGMLSLVSDICISGSPYREKLKKHGSCFRSIEKELHYCIDKYSAEAKALQTEEISNEEKLKKSCCFLETSAECLIAPTMKACGNEAADLIKEAAEKINRPTERICSSVDYDISICSAASSPTISGFLLVIMVIITNLKH